MNRTIKFRGKRIDAGEWCFGNLFIWRKYNSLKTMIGEGVQNGSVMGYEVDPSTVGQFTGLHDKDGKEIYEGDILNSASWVGNSRTLNKNNVVEWNRCGWKAMGYNGTIMVNPDLDVKADFVIIGNIHDNQDLIGSK